MSKAADRTFSAKAQHDHAPKTGAPKMAATQAGGEDSPSPDRVAPSVLVVIGVSGSGKTTIGALLAQRLGWTFEDGDWFHPPSNVEKMSAGRPLTDKDRWPWLHAVAEWIDATMAAERHGVVVCSALKRDYRAVLMGNHGHAVRIVYLDGSRELIGARITMRHGHFMPPELLDSQFATLEVPGKDEYPIAVSIDSHPREVVESIVAALEADLGSPVPAGP